MKSGNKSASGKSATKREPVANRLKLTGKRPSDFPLIEMAALVAQWPDRNEPELRDLNSLLSEQVQKLIIEGYSGVDSESLRVGIGRIPTCGDWVGLSESLYAHLETVIQRQGLANAGKLRQRHATG